MDNSNIVLFPIHIRSKYTPMLQILKNEKKKKKKKGTLSEGENCQNLV